MSDREGVQAVKGGPSEAAIEAAQAHFDRPRCRTVIVDRRNTAQGLAAAFAVDEPHIRGDQTRRIAEWLRQQAELLNENTDYEAVMGAANAIEREPWLSLPPDREFGATTHAE